MPSMLSTYISCLIYLEQSNPARLSASKHTWLLVWSGATYWGTILQAVDKGLSMRRSGSSNHEIL